ncbi:MAG: DNA mismatch repair endonuclease MutL [Candidatus Marinimicrobia bacterium]|nr:DNA mismatch repair endonuclease MutL [Candidatus Neomarinimicrobiota bacterium]MDD9888207.1 DNA mismatch repair endonuclease MutL [Candidatus Neomarinimicrobiota bacterium]
MIKQLSEDLRNKISAGEVVERPASVVKELVENSLDAGATEITVVVEKGGQQLIQVTDNGCGIPSDELPVAFERYSTSKIGTVDDLFAIDTLGFRGEALASIASVSEVNVVSANGSDEGAEMAILNGEIGDVQPAATVQGTSITIRNLFYNTPARKKFLKSPRMEFRKVVEMIRRFALSYPDRAFKLISDNRDILNLQPEDLESRIVHVMDPAYRDQLLPLNYTKGDYSISGFLGNLNLIRTRPGEQYIFLNDRYIQNRLMNSSVYGAYRSLINRGEFPFFALNIKVPHDQVDVNVHPMKTEVRFKDEWRIYHVLKSAVEEALNPILNTIPDFDKPDTGSQFDFPTSFTPQEGQLNPDQQGLDLSASADTAIKFQPAVDRAKSYASKLASRPEPDSGKVDLENIWQVHSKYIVSPISSGLVIIDQHVAHERVLFEEAMAAFDANAMAAQTLLFPEVMEFSPDDFSTLLDVLPYLEKMGFRMKEFGENTVMIEAIPSEMAWGNEKNIIREMLDNYLETQKKYASFQEALAASFACKAAVKAGDVLNIDEMRELVNRLFGTKHPYYCPHGRPIIVQLSMDELDRRFERI